MAQDNQNQINTVTGGYAHILAVIIMVVCGLLATCSKAKAADVPRAIGVRQVTTGNGIEYQLWQDEKGAPKATPVPNLYQGDSWFVEGAKELEHQARVAFYMARRSWFVILLLVLFIGWYRYQERARLGITHGSIRESIVLSIARLFRVQTVQSVA